MGTYIRIQRKVIEYVTVLVFTCIFAIGVVAAAAHVHSQETLYRQFPLTIFTPDGQLYNVDESSKKASDSRDTSSNSIIAMNCQDGIIIDDNMLSSFL